jgi:hypothetical protein
MNAAVSARFLQPTRNDGQASEPAARPSEVRAVAPGAADPAAASGALRWLWQSRFGPMVIEVLGDDVFVNGDRVLPHISQPTMAPVAPTLPPSAMLPGLPNLPTMATMPVLPVRPELPLAA